MARLHGVECFMVAGFSFFSPANRHAGNSFFQAMIMTS